MGERLRIPGARPINRNRSQSIGETRRTDSARRRRFHPSTSIYQMPLIHTQIPKPPSRKTSHFPTPQHRRVTSMRLISGNDLMKTWEDLETEWKIQDIPEYHRNLFKSYAEKLEIPQALSAIVREIEDLREGNAYIQRVMNAILCREHSIEAIKEVLREYESNRVSVQGLTSQLSGLLLTHRTLTLVAIRSIVAWKEYMLDLLGKSGPLRQGRGLFFVWKGQSYMEKLMGDVDFLKQSAASEVFNFAIDSDPLLLAGSLSRTGKVTLPIPKALIGQIEGATKVLLCELPERKQDWRAGLSMQDIETVEAVGSEVLGWSLEVWVRRVVQETWWDLEKWERGRWTEEWLEELTVQVVRETVVEEIRSVRAELYREDNSLIAELLSDSIVTVSVPMETTDCLVDCVFDIIMHTEIAGILDSLIMYRAAVDIIQGNVCHWVALQCFETIYQDFCIECIEESMREALIREEQAQKQAELERFAREQAEKHFQTQLLESQRLQELVQTQEEEIRRLTVEREREEMARITALQAAELKRQVDLQEAESRRQRELQEAEVLRLTYIDTQETLEKQLREALEKRVKERTAELQTQQELRDKESAETQRLVFEAEIIHIEAQQATQKLTNKPETPSESSLRETGLGSTFEAFNKPSSPHSSLSSPHITECYSEEIASEFLQQATAGLVEEIATERVENERMVTQLVTEVVEKAEELVLHTGLVEAVIAGLEANLLTEWVYSAMFDTAEDREIETFSYTLAHNFLSKALIEDELRLISELELTSDLLESSFPVLCKEAVSSTLQEVESEQMRVYLGGIIEDSLCLAVAQAAYRLELVCSEVAGTLMDHWIHSYVCEVMEELGTQLYCQELVISLISDSFTLNFISKSTEMVTFSTSEELFSSLLMLSAAQQLQQDSEVLVSALFLSLSESILVSLPGLVEDSILDLDPHTYTLPFAEDSRMLERLAKTPGPALSPVPMNIDEQHLVDILCGYYQRLPGEIKAYLDPPLEQVVSMKKGNDPQWLWLMGEEKIVGLVACIVDISAASPNRRVVCRHLSSLTPVLYPKAIETAVRYWFSQDSCTEFRVALVTPSLNLTKEMTEIYGGLGFKYKSSNRSSSNMTTIVMGKSRIDGRSEVQLESPNIQIQTRCEVHISESEEPIALPYHTPEMSLAGYRLGLVQILATLRKKEGYSIGPGTTSNLQADIVEKIQQEEVFPRDMTISSPDAYTKVSKLELSIQFPACETQTLQVGSEVYQAFRFQSVQGVQDISVGKISGLNSLFLVNTVEKDRLAFFAVLHGLQEELQPEIETLKSDLYRKVALLVNDLDVRTEPISDLWVPKFSLHLHCSLPWMSNLPLCQSTSSHYLTSCSEQVRIECASGAPPPAQLPTYILRGALITRPFLFGVLSRRENSTFSSPLFVTYVTKERWLRR